MANWLAIGILAGGVIFGFVFGIIIYRFWMLRSNKKIEKNLLEVIAGKRKNEIEIDGEKHEALRFRTRDKDGNETVIDLAGGELEDAKKESIEKEESYNLEELPSIIPEISGSIGKRKRNNGTRLGRFGRRF